MSSGQPRSGRCPGVLSPSAAVAGAIRGRTIYEPSISAATESSTVDSNVAVGYCGYHGYGK